MPLSGGVKSISDLFKVKMIVSPSSLTKSGETETCEETAGNRPPSTSSVPFSGGGNPNTYHSPYQESCGYEEYPNSFYQNDASHLANNILVPQVNYVVGGNLFHPILLCDSGIAVDKSVVDLAVQLANLRCADKLEYDDINRFVPSPNVYLYEETTCKERSENKSYQHKRFNERNASLFSPKNKNKVKNHFNGSSTFRAMNDWEKTSNMQSIPSASVKKLAVAGKGKGVFLPRRGERADISSVSSSTYSSGSVRYRQKRRLECALCRTNGETEAVYRGHALKDSCGQTICPVLQKYVCPSCGETGMKAHTINYCPKTRQPGSLPIMSNLRTMRLSNGKLRYGRKSSRKSYVPQKYNM